MLENITTWYIIQAVAIMIDMSIYFVVIDSLGERSISKGKYILRVIFMLILVGSLNLSSIHPNIKIMTCIITGNIFYKLSYKDKLHKTIIVNLIFWLYIMVSEGTAMTVVLTLNKINHINAIITGELFRMQSLILSKMILFIGFILFKYSRLSLEFKPKDMVFIGLPIATNIVSLLLIFGYNYDAETISKGNMIIFIIASILLIASSITLLVVIRKIIQNDKLELEYELINERIKTNYKGYENINQVHNKLRYIHHDLKNHLICIKSYKTREEMISYINNLEFEIDDFDKFTKTGNETLDIVVGEKIHLCEKYNIEFNENINVSKLEFIKNYDLCAIFANALDNAIEACLNISEGQDRNIEAKATYVNGFAMIKFTNTKNNEIKVLNDTIQTSKSDFNNHGIGLASIKYIVRKYGGEVIIDYSENEFILKIMIPIIEQIYTK